MTIGTYNKVKKVFKGCSNIEVHHVIEKRFLQCKKMYRNGSLLTEGAMMSVPLEKEFHRVITNRWRTAISYGLDYKDISKQKMREAIKKVYYDMPALKEYALKYLEEVWNR